jgi:lysophospholipase L1-like esterase
MVRTIDNGRVKMSAKNGWMRSFRLLGCLMAVSLLASALFASVASAMKVPLKPTAYVALGDSLSFGYKAKTFNENKATNAASCAAGVEAAENSETALAYTEKALCEPAASFEPGFVGYFGGKLAKTEKKVGNELTTVNLGCPGETSGGLIGGLLGGVGAEYSPCAYHNQLPGQGFPLKTEFGHTTSQLEEAISLIQEKTVTAVSLQIGSNDELHVLGKCESSVYRSENGFSSVLQCAEHEAGPAGFAYPGGLINHILTDIGATIETLRSPGGANYAGKIVVLGFYNPYGTQLFGSDELVKILNENLESLVSGDPNIHVANPLPLVNPEAALYTEGEASKEKAKKINKENSAICKYTEMCTDGDIHPTAKGYKSMAKLLVEAF